MKAATLPKARWAIQVNTTNSGQAQHFAVNAETSS